MRQLNSLEEGLTMLWFGGYTVPDVAAPFLTNVLYAIAKRPHPQGGFTTDRGTGFAVYYARFGDHCYLLFWGNKPPRIEGMHSPESVHKWIVSHKEHIHLQLSKLPGF